MVDRVYVRPAQLFRFVAPVLKPFADRVSRAYRRSVSGRGRKHYPCLPMLFACIWMSLKGLSQRGLDRALEVDHALATACGFDSSTPSQPTLSRFIDRMGDAGISLAMRLMVIHLVERGIVRMRHLALDSEPLEAYFRNDPEAEWGYSVKLCVYK
ncbi:MAG: transposase, partial [Nitrososphaerota archaeon]